jgi:hypothetical protein
MTILICAAVSALVSAAVSSIVGAVLLKKQKAHFAARDLHYREQADRGIADAEQRMKTLLSEQVSQMNTAISTNARGVAELRESLEQKQSRPPVDADLGAGIANILGYDPMEAIRKKRDGQRSDAP